MKKIIGLLAVVSLIGAGTSVLGGPPKISSNDSDFSKLDALPDLWTMAARKNLPPGWIKDPDQLNGVRVVHSYHNDTFQKHNLIDTDKVVYQDPRLCVMFETQFEKNGFAFQTLTYYRLVKGAAKDYETGHFIDQVDFASVSFPINLEQRADGQPILPGRVDYKHPEGAIVNDPYGTPIEKDGQKLPISKEMVRELSRPEVPYGQYVLELLRKNGYPQPGAGGPEGCFVAGTLVDAPDGRIPIEELKPGDRVYSYDVENHRRVIGTVSKTFQFPDRKYGQLVLNNGEAVIGVTGEHPFYLFDSGRWEKIADIDLSKMSLTQLASKRGNGYEESLGKLQGARFSIPDNNPPATVYNIEVDGLHNFFVNGLLVHNK